MLEAFDWETDDRQYALEQIDGIVSGGGRERPDSFSVYLRELPADEIDYRVVDDGRHILSITTDVGLYVRPDEGDLPA